MWLLRYEYYSLSMAMPATTSMPPDHQWLSGVMAVENTTSHLFVTMPATYMYHRMISDLVPNTKQPLGNVAVNIRILAIVCGRACCYLYYQITSNH